MDTNVMICYVDKNGQKGFAAFDGKNYFEDDVFNIERYKLDNPDIHIRAVFRESDNLVETYDREKETFYKLCSSYDFEPDDYKRLVIDKQGNQYVFVGFLPQNHKYKAQLFRRSDSRYVRSTLEFVRRYITCTST